jgi:hypothetical protein
VIISFFLKLIYLIHLVDDQRAYSQPCGKISLYAGDFLEHSEVHEIIKRADVIFVNK